MLRRVCWLGLFALVAAWSQISAAEPQAPAVSIPKVLRPGWKLQLIAVEPDIVTPTALAILPTGEVLVVESHTHFPPKDYAGPKADRIWLFADFDAATGKPATRKLFFEGSVHTMGLAVEPSGAVLVATRNEIFRLSDQNHDRAADETLEKRQTLVRLETAGNYPHNGLSGFAVDGNGTIFFGFGENLGATYTLHGTDGSKLTGGGEGGNVYGCDRAGGKLTLVATGFWNPFHLCLNAQGQLFTVDNDPDSRPPCRLLHVIEGGDYGFRFRHGRKGVSPLTAWNGELPGTLPMIAGTGEAPCAVLSPVSDAWQPAQQTLLVTSWGDHRIEAYDLMPRGASYGSTMKPMVVGDDQFRPVGMAEAADGSIFISDWVDRSYQLHGKGRIWRLVPDKLAPVKPRVQAPPVALLGIPQFGNISVEELLSSSDPFMATQATTIMAKEIAAGSSELVSALKKQSSAARQGEVENLVARAPAWVKLLGSCGDELLATQALTAGIASKNPRAQVSAGLALAARRDQAQMPMATELLERAQDRATFEVALALLAILQGDPAADPKKEASVQPLVARVALDPATSSLVRKLAFRSLEPTNAETTLAKLEPWVASQELDVALEAVAAIRDRRDNDAHTYLQKLATDVSQPSALRAAAAMGLHADVAEDRSLLVALATDDEPQVAAIARRVLRGNITPEELAKTGLVASDFARPADHPQDDLASAWTEYASLTGDPRRGELLFVHQQVTQCAKCHQYRGRGGKLGPDLTAWGLTGDAAQNRRRLVESIIEPSREIAPQFSPWLMQLEDGRVISGILVAEEVDGTQQYADTAGKIHRLHPRDIFDKKPSPISIMPKGLARELTRQELADLIAFLSQPAESASHEKGRE